MTTKSKVSTVAGQGVDFQGNAVIDPTANVLLLVEAANKRQDDLRAAENAFWAASIKHLHEMAALREDHMQMINALESKRIDAIRQVDVLAVNTAADRQTQAIGTLAAQTTANAETLRSMVATTATAIATQTAQTVSGITERISALEKSSYMGAGKQAVSDPAMAELVQQVKNLATSRDQVTGSGKGISLVGALIVGAAVVIFGALSLAVAIYAALRPH